MNQKKVNEYSNGEITIAWKPGLCTHVRIPVIPDTDS